MPLKFVNSLPRGVFLDIISFSPYLTNLPENMMTLRNLLASGIVVACLTAAIRADTGYEAFSNWSLLPYATPGVTAGVMSSYDRNEDTLGVDGLYDTNTDYGQYVAPDPNNPGWSICGSLTGAGVITRFWMPHDAADNNFGVRIYADGSLVLNTTSSALLSGSGGPSSTGDANTNASLFSGPLVNTLLGGQVSYEPIGFNKSVVVEMQSSVGQYNWYQFDYHLLPAGSSVPTYNGTLTSSQLSSRQAAVTTLMSAGSNPAGTNSGDRIVNASTPSLAMGGSLPLATFTSGGTIRGFNLTIGSGNTAPTDAQLDGLYLQVRYDNSSVPAVNVPVSSFFGVGHGRAAYQSLPLGVTAGTNNNYYCYWPMPFQQNASVSLVNEGTSAVSSVVSAVDFNPTAPGANAQYFHAVANSQTTVAGQSQYNLLHITETGRYVGNLLSFNSGNANVLEGDDVITIDGSSHMYGTGFEDAYNGGYYFNHADENSGNGDVPDPTSGATPLYGLLNYANGGSGASAYRWMISDSVPFTTSLDVSQENTYQYGGVNWESTAFYYSSDVPEPSMTALVAICSTMLLRRRRKIGTIQ